MKILYLIFALCLCCETPTSHYEPPPAPAENIVTIKSTGALGMPTIEALERARKFLGAPDGSPLGGLPGAVAPGTKGRLLASQGKYRQVRITFDDGSGDLDLWFRAIDLQ
jgi:hypothetical protein